VDSLVISAKDLGSFAVYGACTRCLWIGLHCKRLPYQSFPGIFSSIDAYNKRIVHRFFDREGVMPDWLSSLGNIEGYIEPPSYHKFSYYEPEFDVTIRGTPDGVFKMCDGSYTIVDYKTAKYTAGQERMFPIYRAQLNGYAYLGNRLNLSPVSRIVLIYMEPVTDEETAASPDMVTQQGFTMGLSATVVPVELDPDRIVLGLMKRARHIYDMQVLPDSRKGCRDCLSLTGLTSLIQL